jgi:hypothetical protein
MARYVGQPGTAPACDGETAPVVQTNDAAHISAAVLSVFFIVKAPSRCSAIADQSHVGLILSEVVLTDKNWDRSI